MSLCISNCFSSSNLFVRTFPLLFPLHTALLSLTRKGSFIFKDLGKQTTSCFPFLVKMHLSNLKPCRWWQDVLWSGGSRFKLIMENWKTLYLWCCQLSLLFLLQLQIVWDQLQREDLLFWSLGYTKSCVWTLAICISSSSLFLLPTHGTSMRCLGSPPAKQSICSLEVQDCAHSTSFCQQRVTTVLVIKSGNSLLIFLCFRGFQ